MSTNIVRQNTTALAPRLANEYHMRRHPRTCWKCQKDKPILGGKQTLKPGFYMFVCKDCMDAKKLKETT